MQITTMYTDPWNRECKSGCETALITDEDRGIDICVHQYYTEPGAWFLTWRPFFDKAPLGVCSREEAIARAKQKVLDFTAVEIRYLTDVQPGISSLS